MKLSKRRAENNSSHWQLAGMTLPGVIYIFIFSYLPMIGLVIAFKNYRYDLGIFKSPWVGFDNFKFMFESNTFDVILKNTLGYNLVFILLSVVCGVCVALLFDAIKNKTAIKIYQSSMFLPHFLSWIVVSYISHALLSYDLGIINKIITFFGGEKISFYSEPAYWFCILTVFYIWKSLGFGMLIYYGSLLAIDTELYEAAAIDGCTYMKRVWYITLPQLKQTVITMVLLSLGGIFRSDYGLFYYLPKQSGALINATDVIDTYILRALSVSGSIGGASAAGFVQSVVGFVVVVTFNKIVEKIDESSTLF